jgi:hypothetical protein
MIHTYGQTERESRAIEKDKADREIINKWMDVKHGQVNLTTGL